MTWWGIRHSSLCCCTCFNKMIDIFTG
uniref:Uncharacterized protein n=1 Tax=Gasterosteus aculeatus TaxID=69293 RepID=G3NL49_GASAC